MVIDVGGVYDPATCRYDHHQREFTEKFGDGFDVTKMSSAGRERVARAVTTMHPSR